MTLEDNPRGRQAIEISTAFNGIALIVVILRVYTRVFIVRHFGVEDGFAVFALVCSMGLTVTIGLQAMCGMGEHHTELEPNILRDSLKAFYASLIVYNLGLGLIKLSILLQYKRLFPTKKFQILCWIVITVVALHTAWAVFGSIFACFPVHVFWEKNEEGACLNQFAMWFTNASLTILTDFSIILLPLHTIRTLSLPLHQKHALTAIFAIGGFVCIVSILRLHSLIAISNSDDPTFDNPPAATWSAVEMSVGIVCACLPCLRPLGVRWWPRAFEGGSLGVDGGSEESFYSEEVGKREG
ncbi:unnamed protein product [Periconia digitata]|uniref:Rhodopsin domain-containing protein n=1 Tax=Periconia digitata TaxID=1303443 RepID=A0A9W4U7Y3_9PLEO|nr:unnamed protein product [Periconia digitata]